MNTLVLEVFIGLIFIYLLHSIFVSVIAEIIATRIGLRSKVLRQGIISLLTDLLDKEGEEYKNSGIGQYIQDYLRLIQKALLFKPQGYQYSKAKDFYDQPSIKYLSRGRRLWLFIRSREIPSYIAKENFSSTLINMLRKQGRGIHDWGKVSFSVENNACHFDPGTAKQLHAMLEDADDDMEVFIQRLEMWYEETMDRVVGWYKRKVKLLIFLLGFIMAIILNLDTLEIIDTLSNHDALREQLVKMAETQVERNSDSDTIPPDTSNQQVQPSEVPKPSNFDELTKAYMEVAEEVDQVHVLLGSGWNYKKTKETIPFKFRNWRNKEISIKESVDKIEELTDSITAYKSRLDDRNLPYLKFISLSKSLQYASKDRKRELDIISYKSGKQIIAFEGIKGGSVIVQTVPRFGGKFWHIVKKGVLSPIKLGGLLLTAIAIYLGAPFWFDLLKLLVAIRGVGIKPEEKEEANKKGENGNQDPRFKEGKSKLGKTIKDASPIDIVLEQNRKKWESMEGVIAVNKVLYEEKSGFEPVIMISGKSGYNLNSIKSKIIYQKEKDQGPKISVKIKKEIASVANYHQNRNEIESSGTIAGMLKNLETNNNCLLTCAHVFSLNGQSMILDGMGINEHGSLYNMAWTNFIDAAVIDLEKKFYGEYSPIPLPYVVTSEDSKSRRPVTIHTASGKKEANIFREITSHTFDKKSDSPFQDSYTVRNIIAIAKKPQNSDFNSVATEEGDSGSLVTTKQGQSIGIIIGGYSNSSNGRGFSFVVPMESILRILNLDYL